MCLGDEVPEVRIIIPHMGQEPLVLHHRGKEGINDTDLAIQIGIEEISNPFPLVRGQVVPFRVHSPQEAFGGSGKGMGHTACCP